MALESEFDRQIWDERWWLFAQKSDKVMETYQELVAEKGEAPPNLDELPADRKAWYRA
jgi:hypothetical protein